MTAHLPTVALLVAAAALTFSTEPADPAPAGHLPFEVRGLRGPIRGTVVLDGDRIAEVQVHQSREGTDRRALDDPAAVAGYVGQPARPPVLVDVVSGATLSCRRLLDAVNDGLAAHVDAQEAPP